MKHSQAAKTLAAAGMTACMAPAAIAADGSVITNDTASFRLVMFGDLGSTLSINQGGNVSIMRGPVGASMGLNINDSTNGTVMGKWDELDNPNNPATRLVVAEIWTSNKADLMPFGIIKNNENFFFWTWNEGATNPINFTNNSTVQLFSARVQMIRVETNNAQTVLANKSITDLPSNWNGVDDGQTQTMVGQGMNLVRLTYEIQSVPAPGALVLGGLGTLLAFRRRRGV